VLTLFCVVESTEFITDGMTNTQVELLETFHSPQATIHLSLFHASISHRKINVPFFSSLGSTGYNGYAIITSDIVS
jgi:hypothetical protein